MILSNCQISQVIGQLGGSIYYEGNPQCVDKALEKKWHVIETGAWKKDLTLTITCDNGRIWG